MRQQRVTKQVRIDAALHKKLRLVAFEQGKLLTNLLDEYLTYIISNNLDEQVASFMRSVQRANELAPYKDAVYSH